MLVLGPAVIDSDGSPIPYSCRVFVLFRAKYSVPVACYTSGVEPNGEIERRAKLGVVAICSILFITRLRQQSIPRGAVTSIHLQQRKRPRGAGPAKSHRGGQTAELREGVRACQSVQNG